MLLFITCAGAWETKISNREKRQQRKRDKVLTDAGSESNLPGMENSVTVCTEQLTSATSFSVGPRKSRGIYKIVLFFSTCLGARGYFKGKKISLCKWR